MDVLEFVASLVKSLAWPAALVMIVIAFRRPVRKILNRIAKRVGNMTELRAWKVRAKFAEKTTQVNQEIADEASNIDPPIQGNNDEGVDFEGESPREIVTLAWLDLEDDLRLAAEMAGIPLDPRRAPAIQLRHHLPADIQKRLRKLMALRNEAAHARDFSVSRESAISYARAASKLGAIVRHPSIVMQIRVKNEEPPAPET
jgi:hypothetical protein